MDKTGPLATKMPEPDSKPLPFLTFNLMREEAQNEALTVEVPNMMGEATDGWCGWLRGETEKWCNESMTWCEENPALLAACLLAVVTGSIIWRYRESLKGLFYTKKDD